MRTTLLIGLCLAAEAAFAAPDCAALLKLSLPNTTVTRAESVAAGTFTPPGHRPMPYLPAFCRVSGVIKPSADSNIPFEVWMPAAGWNGRFQGAGNGGFAGSILYDQMATALTHGYATAGTDTGHQGGMADAGWARQHPEKVIDFGYRAIHDMTTTARAVIGAYYGEPPAYSYFSSCSNGGRQALMEAQRYPDDYDGIIAGAPANYLTHLFANAVWDLLALRGDAYIPSRKLPAIEAAALAACDALDGANDGIIADPAHCQFDPAILRCKGAETDSCLTTPQVDALKKLYAGGRLSNGTPLFPGYTPGGEADPGGWATWITGPAPERSVMYAFGTQFFRNMVFNDPTWDYRSFNADRDSKVADEKLGPVLNATDPDLSRFQSRGGKLILYHGWSDAAIAPRNTIDYYQNVTAKMGQRRTDGFVRLYMVPGMEHCFGGPGPSSFGQLGVAGGDADHDMEAALERWVERGVAPGTIIGAKRRSDFDPASPVLRTMPICVWPKAPRYLGKGSTNDAASFACR